MASGGKGPTDGSSGQRRCGARQCTAPAPHSPPPCSPRAARGERAQLSQREPRLTRFCKLPFSTAPRENARGSASATGQRLAHRRAPLADPSGPPASNREGTAARSARLVKRACAVARLAQLGPVKTQSGVTLLSQLRVLRAATRTATSSRPTNRRQPRTPTESAGSAAAHALLLSRAQGTPLLVPGNFLCLRQHGLRRPLLMVPNNSSPYTHTRASTENVKGDR